MLNGLDLFSGIGGISLALKPWVRTIAYCERDRYAQSVLMSRMVSGDLDRAPIWDDVTTLRGEMLPSIDIIFGGFPCQDISVAGNSKGLDGERSGLFFEIIRLVRECRPSFVFLENVPAIRTRGLSRVIKEFSDCRYECRWTSLSAQEVGAPHKRERWFLLAANAELMSVRFESRRCCRKSGKEALFAGADGEQESLADSSGVRELSEQDSERVSSNRISNSSKDSRASWWSVEPSVGRVANGVQFRVDRLRCLGNAVVPEQAQQAFKELIGIRE